MDAVVPDELGEFAIEGELGQGGSGIVFAARNHGEPVALKVLKADDAATEKERERFLGEARLLARIRHPHVVRVLGSGLLPDGRPYLVMERLGGASLAERLLMGRLPVGQALALFDQIAGAVAALHAGGIVHRDIKPENIMLVEGGQRAVLLDFGIARGVDDAMSTTTQLGLQRGTPAYMAPERFFGARATIGSDVYETAVVLFVMLTGHLPWRDPRSPQDRLEPRAPSSLGVELAPGLERELMRALAPRPEGRPASIDELARAVRRHAFDGDTVAAPPPGVHGTGPGNAAVAATTSLVRRPVVIGGALIGLAGAAIAAAVVLGAGGGTAGRAVALDVAVAVGPDAAAVVGPAPVVVAEVAPEVVVDAGVPVDAAPGPAPRPRTRVAPTPTPAAPAPSPASAVALPTCERLVGLYCTDEFKATEGGMAGTLCKNMRGVLAQWKALPDPQAQEAWCLQSWPTMSAAVAERLRQWKAGVGPGQGGAAPAPPAP